MTLNTSEIVSWLVKSAPSLPASEFLGECRNSGMQASPVVDVTLDSERAYAFRFVTNDGQVAYLDMKEEDGHVLQATLMVLCTKSFFFSKSKKLFNSLRNQLDKHFSSGKEELIDNVTTMDYRDSSTMCLLFATSAAEKDHVTVQVGNKRFFIESDD